MKMRSLLRLKRQDVDRSDFISQYVVYSFNPNQTPRAPKWYSIGI